MKTQLLNSEVAQEAPAKQNNLPSMIALMERNDSYLMKVDLPSLPMDVGDIISRTNELVVESSESRKPARSRSWPLSNLISINTLGGKMKAIYQGGSLYIMLPKGA